MTAQPDLVAAASEELGSVPEHRAHEFRMRLERYGPDLIEPLSRLYADPEAVAHRLVRLAARAFADRPTELQDLDERRLLTPDWLQRPDRIGYSCYADRFGGTLAGVGERAAYLKELGVTYLHLMPILDPRDGDNDGGYAVRDYRKVRADLGTVEDLRALTSTLRKDGISVVLDLVLNHVADEHEWVRRARAGEQHYRDYFYIYPDRTMPEAYEATLPEVFPDFAPGNFTFDEQLNAWVWTTFNEWQWDVNWSNPDLLLEYADIVGYLANLGVEVLRLDAIAFTWKRLGTNCQNQPEVQDLTQVLRAFARIVCPAVVFKAEAIVGPRDLVPYLGTGTHAGKVCDLAYHNSLMVQIWSMLATGNTVLAKQALGGLPTTPTVGTWICYVRCHDDIGWAIDDGDAAMVGLNGFGHRAFLSSFYSGEYGDSWADGLVFQANPATGDKRISGTAASLLGMTDGLPDGEGAARMFLAHAIAFGWGGIPVIWSGDELATPNDPVWNEELGHEDDNRWAHRPRLDEARINERTDGTTDAGAAFQGIQHLVKVRQALPQLHASNQPEIVRDTDPGVLVAIRRHAAGPMVLAYNVSRDWRPVPASIVRSVIDRPWNALGDHPVDLARGEFWLPPYAAWWIVESTS